LDASTLSAQQPKSSGWMHSEANDPKQRQPAHHVFCGLHPDNIPISEVRSYVLRMSDLPTDLYVALRTAPKTVVKRYASCSTAVAGDEATREMVAIIMKVLDNYTIEHKERPRPPGHKTW
jgi:hypothetical protein